MNYELFKKCALFLLRAFSVFLLLVLFLFWFLGYNEIGLYAPLVSPYETDFAQRTITNSPDAAVIEAAYNPDVVNILILGLDSETQAEQTMTTMHQADTILLCSFNRKTADISLLFIPRGIVLSTPHYDIFGELAYYADIPLCNAHALGRTQEDATMMMLSATQTILGGVPIAGVVSLDFSIIGGLVDAMDGITVSCFFDIAHYYGVGIDDPVFLNGEGAMEYIRARNLPGMDGTNETRMMRQLSFVEDNLLPQLIETVTENPFSAFGIYHNIAPYYETTLPFRALSYIATQFLLQDGSVSFSVIHGNDVKNLVVPDYDWIADYITRICCQSD